MKPCDCKDMYSVNKLNEQGTGFNGEYSLMLEPVNVIIGMRNCLIKIPQNVFKRFAEWYLEDQEISK